MKSLNCRFSCESERDREREVITECVCVCVARGAHVGVERVKLSVASRDDLLVGQVDVVHDVLLSRGVRHLLCVRDGDGNGAALKVVHR